MLTGVESVVGEDMRGTTMLDGRVRLFVCLLFYVLATSKVISGGVSTCDSAHSWRLSSAAQQRSGLPAP